MWKRVIMPTLLVSLLWVAFGGASTYYIHWLGRSHMRILTENVASIRAAWLMQESLWKVQAIVAEDIDRGLPANRSRIAEHEAQFESSLAAAEQAATSPPEQSLVKLIRLHFLEYRDFIHRKLEPDASIAGARRPLADESARMARAVEALCKELLTLNEHLRAESIVRSTRIENSLNLVRMVFLIVGPAVGIFIGFRIAQGLHRSISQISVTLNDATGDLDHEIGRVEIATGGDRGDLSALNQQVQVISTRIKQVLSELQKARDEAMRSERLAVVGELAAGVAHELRNPLTSVKLLIQTAARKSTSWPLDVQQAHIILQEISRMETTIQGLLDFAGPQKMHRLRHDLRETVRRALNLVEGRASHEHVLLESNLAERPLLFDGDPEQLHQVFVNLLINGIESMPQGGTLQVAAEIDEPVFRLAFSDSGCGIPVTSADRIFEPFVTSKERGTGLGLAITRRIVHAHGGRITGANRPGGGAVFTVELPICPPMSADSDRGDPVNGDSSAGRGRTIPAKVTLGAAHA